MKIAIAFLLSITVVAIAACASMEALSPERTAKSVEKTKETICKHYCGRFSEQVRLEFRAAYGGAIVVNCPVLCGPADES